MTLSDTAVARRCFEFPGRRLIIVIVLSVLVWVLFSWIGIDRVKALATGHCVRVVTPDQVTVIQDEIVTFDVTIESLTLWQSVTVVGIRLPCNCLQVSPVPVTLRPGESVTVQVAFDAAEQPVRVVEAEIGLFLSVESAPVAIPLSIDIQEKPLFLSGRFIKEIRR